MNLDKRQKLFQQWLESDFGRQLAACESQTIHRFMASIYGYHGLEILAGKLQQSLLARSQIMSPLKLHAHQSHLCGAISTNISDWPFCPQTFTCIASFHMHDLIEHQFEYLAALSELIEPGGTLMISGLNPHSPLKFFSPNQAIFHELFTLAPKQITQFLSSLNYEILYNQPCLLSSNHSESPIQTSFFDRAGFKLGLPGLGYVIIARKTRFSGDIIKLRSQQKQLSGVKVYETN